MGTYESDKKNTRFVGLKFNIRTDADILARLDGIDNKQDYIKRLIRADIAASNAQEPFTSSQSGE